jgi:hypothetical protein
MKHFIEFEKMSKTEQKRILKSHRKPPIPPARKEDSRAEKMAKRGRIEKQNGYKDS